MLNLAQHSDDLRTLRAQLVSEWRNVDPDQLDRVQAELYRRASNTCRAIRLELERRYERRVEVTR